MRSLTWCLCSSLVMEGTALAYDPLHRSDGEPPSLLDLNVADEGRDRTVPIRVFFVPARRP